jgi:hypothetical protein
VHNRNSDTHIFNRLTSETQQLILSALRPPTLLLYPYHNTKTFVNLTNSLSIPKDKLVLLDNYAFDVDELVENAKYDVKNFYRNPHITDKHENNSFSEAAIEKLRQHPMLSQYAKTLDETLATQANGINKETVDAVLALVKEFDENGVAGSAQAKCNFDLYFYTLSETEKNKLNNYIINVKSKTGGNQSLSFEAAIVGGNRFDQCILTARVYLWQFVIDFRPAEMINIPASVSKIVARMNLKFEAKNQYFSMLPPQSYPPHLEMPPVIGSAVTPLIERSIFIGDRHPMSSLAADDELPFNDPRDLATFLMSSHSLATLRIPFHSLPFLMLIAGALEEREEEDRDDNIIVQMFRVVENWLNDRLGPRPR